MSENEDNQYGVEELKCRCRRWLDVESMVRYDHEVCCICVGFWQRYPFCGESAY